MAKIYQALKAAQQEHEQRGGAKGGSIPSSTGSAQALREKMLAVYQAIHTIPTPGKAGVVAFMGSRPGEGASTLVRAFSRFVSEEMGKRVLLLDADHGFGGHDSAFGVRLETTCEEAAAEGSSAEQALLAVGGETLKIGCLAGPGTSLPALTASPVFRDIFAHLRGSSDFIFLDTPPVQESSDALLLMPEIDGVVMIVEAEKTRWQVARSVRTKLEKQGGTVLGVVLNKRRHYIPQSIYKLL